MNLATSAVRMISGRASPACFQDSGMITPPGIMQTLRFPGSAVFHKGVQHFRWLHNYDSPCKHCYTAYLSYNCIYVWPRLHGGMCTCYGDCCISPATHAASKPTNLYGSMLMVIICHALITCLRDVSTH